MHHPTPSGERGMHRLWVLNRFSYWAWSILSQLNRLQHSLRLNKYPICLVMTRKHEQAFQNVKAAQIKTTSIETATTTSNQ